MRRAWVVFALWIIAKAIVMFHEAVASGSVPLSIVSGFVSCAILAFGIGWYGTTAIGWFEHRGGR